MDKIYPCLWFDDRIEEAVNFYAKLFKGKVLHTSRYGDAGPLPKGKVLTMHFELFGKTFMALNGGPQFRFNEAVSLYVDCEDQTEVDRYWNALTADGGSESMCGWLKDKYGLSWQIIPKTLGRYIGGSDEQGANRAMQAMLKMQKIDVAALERAYAG